MKQETENELFELLYDLELEFDFDETEIGKRVGEIINKLQKELLNK
jgi:hypothetical protein